MQMGVVFIFLPASIAKSSFFVKKHFVVFARDVPTRADTGVVYFCPHFGSDEGVHGLGIPVCFGQNSGL